MEIVMVIAVVLGMLMVMKVSAKESSADKTVSDHEDEERE